VESHDGWRAKVVGSRPADTRDLDLAAETSTWAGRHDTIRVRMEVLERRYVRNDRVVSREIAEETILVPICSDVADLSSVYILNAVGAAVWAKLGAERTGRGLAHGIAEEFETTLETAERDVAAFLEELASAGLVAAVELTSP
jgi:hypothetical protein